MFLSLEIIKETRKALKEAEKKVVEEMRLRKALINAKTDFAMLEQFIQCVNTNPGLKIKFTTRDGTTVELETVPKKLKTYTEILGEMNE